jgi:hypothetical protein
MDIQLLLHDSAPAEDEPVTRFGGRPLAPSREPFAWPVCRACEGNMQFLGQLRLPNEAGDRLLLLFMCQNDPGVCDEWEADAGGNRAIVLGTEGLAVVEFPPAGEVSRNTMYGARVEEHATGDYDEARAAWTEEHEGRGREVLGQLFGTPGWIQGDQTPECDACHEPMRFVAQLEEGPEIRTSMNFGGGAAFVFDCDCEAASAKLLWQQ